jgi:CIC family chloride channel protein
MEAAAIGAVSGLSVGGVRLVFRLLQWCVTGHAGLFSAATDELPLWRRAATPALGGLAAMVVLTIARRVTSGLITTEYVEAVRFEEGRISLVSTYAVGCGSFGLPNSTGSKLALRVTSPYC